MADLFNLRKL